MSSSEKPPGVDLATAPLPVVLAELGLPPGWADVLIAGDGSGSGWEMGGGWAAVVIDLRSDGRKLLTAGYSAATNVHMEIAPHYHALLWYSQAAGKGALEALGRPPRIVVVTDNELVAKQGNRENRAKVLEPWWAAIRAVVQAGGFAVRWVWDERDRLGLNRLCDHMSRESRLNHATVTMETRLPGVDLWQVNPKG